MYVHADGISQLLFIYDLNVTDGVVSALCTSPIKDITNCSIQFSRDPFYNNLSFPITIPMNEVYLFTFIGYTPAVYYHQASVVVNSTLEIIVHSSNILIIASNDIGKTDDNSTFLNQSITSGGVVMLKIYQLGLLGLVIAVLFSSLLISIGVVIFHRGMLCTCTLILYFACVGCAMVSV